MPKALSACCIEKIAAIATCASPCPQNKIAAKWARRITNRQTGILDTGATPCTAAKQDIKALENTSQPSTKVFMLPDKSKIQATHKMLLKQRLWEGAREMNVVLGLHSTLVSIPIWPMQTTLWYLIKTRLCYQEHVDPNLSDLVVDSGTTNHCAGKRSSTLVPVQGLHPKTVFLLCLYITV